MRWLAFWLLVAIKVSAQNLIVPVVAYTAANIADGITTTHFPPNVYEKWSPELYGRRPTTLSYFGPAFGIEAGQVLLAWKLRNSRHKWIRVAGQVQLWYGVGSHASGFAWNMAHGYY